MKILTTITRVTFAAILVPAILLPWVPTPSRSDRLHASDLAIVPGLVVPKPDCLPKDPPPPVLKLKVRVPACSATGRAIVYHICVENCSPAEAHHVVVKDVLPDNVKFLKSDPMPAKQSPELQWQLGTIGGGACREITLHVLPTNKEDVKNCIRVQFEHGQCLVTRQAASPMTPGVPPIVNVEPVPSEQLVPPPPEYKTPPIKKLPEGVKPENLPVLDLKIEGPPNHKQFANRPAKYFIKLTNKGKSTANNAQLRVQMPATLKLVNASDGGNVTGKVVTWPNFPPLEPGATRVVNMTLKATEQGKHCFKVLALADQGVTAEEESCTEFVGFATMTLEMFGEKGVLFLGSANKYPLTITPQGGAPLLNVRVKAFIPDSLQLDKTNAEFDKRYPDPAGKAGEWIEFKTMPKIDPGYQATYQISVIAVRGGFARFEVLVFTDELGIRPVEEQELTVIIDDSSAIVRRRTDFALTNTRNARQSHHRFPLVKGDRP